MLSGLANETLNLSFADSPAFTNASMRHIDMTRALLVGRVLLLVSNEVGADGFTRCVFDRLVGSNILRAKNLDCAIVGLACSYRLERR